MNDQVIDAIGEVIFYTAFATPLLTVPIAWRWKKMHPILRILTGLLLAGVLTAWLATRPNPA